MGSTDDFVTACTQISYLSAVEQNQKNLFLLTTTNPARRTNFVLGLFTRAKTDFSGFAPFLFVRHIRALVSKKRFETRISYLENFEGAKSKNRFSLCFIYV
jgi:hypothetical protein